MAIYAEVDGVGTLEFPDNTSDDVIDRAVKKEVLGKQSRDAQSEIDLADNFIGAVDTVAPWVGRVSLGGIGRLSGAVAKDFLTATPSSMGPLTPGAATAAELRGQPTPEFVQQQIDESVVKRGLVGAAESLPVVGASIAASPAGLPALASSAIGGALAMGASAREASGGDTSATVQGALTGAAIPYLGAAGRLGGAAVTGAAVNRGATALANPVVQRAIEAGASQVPIQALLLGEMISTDEYQQASPEDQRKMLAEYAISNVPFGIPDALHAFNPKVRPLAQQFESPAVELSRMLSSSESAKAADEALTTLSGQSDPITGVREAVTQLNQPQENQNAIQEQGANESVLRGQRSELGLQEVGQGDQINQEASGTSAKQQTAPGLTTEGGGTLEAQGQKEGQVLEGNRKAGASNWLPANPPSSKTRRALVEQGMYLDQPNEGGSTPQVEIISKAQRRKINAQLEREQGLRPGRKTPEQPQPISQPAEPPKIQGNVASTWNDAASAVAGATADELSAMNLRTLDSGSRAIEATIGLLEQNGADATQEYKALIRADREISRRLKEPEYVRQMNLLPGGYEALQSLREAAGYAAKRQKMRKLAARASVSPEVPESVQRAVARNPDSFYKVQNGDEVAEQVSKATEAQLAADAQDLESDTSVASSLEQVRRSLSAGDNAGAEQLLVSLAKRGTTLGQLVNQFKMLKGVLPEQVTLAVDKHLSNAGYDPLPKPEKERITKLAQESMDADRARKAADDAYRNNPSPETWTGVADASDKADQASQKLNYEIARKHPRAMSDVFVAILQGNVMSPISQIANVAGNSFRLFYEPPVRGAGAMFDAVESAITGKSRTLTANPVGGYRAAFEALPHAGKVAKDIIVHGSDTAHIEAGQHGGVRLNAIRAMRDLRDIIKRKSDLPTKNGKVPVADVVKLTLESTFGLPSDFMLRGLGAMDAAFRYPTRARIAYGLARKAGLGEVEAMRATRRPELFLSKKDMKTLEFEAARAVYQQDNATTGLAGDFNRRLKSIPGVGEFAHLAARSLVLFQKTPINVLGELLSYTPVGLLKLSADIATGNRREANLTAAKVLVGAGMMAAANWMYGKGVISPPLEAGDETQKARTGATDVLPPSHINISGLKRAIKGEDASPRPGDEVKDLRRLGLPGGLIYLMSFGRRQVEKKRDGTTSVAWEMASGAPSVITQWALNQSFLQGISDFVKSLSQGQEERAVQSWVNTVASFAAPNTLSAVSRAIRDFKPEFRDDDALKAIGNRLNEKLNTVGLSVPFGKDTKNLPLKVDLWGRPIQETPKGANPLVYSFFDITKGREIPDDSVAITLYNLWRNTSDSAVFPSYPDRIISDKGKQSEPIPYELYQSLATKVGQARRRGVENLMSLPVFGQVGDADKIKLLKMVYDKGLEIGQAQFKAELAANGIKLEERKQRRAQR